MAAYSCRVSCGVEPRKAWMMAVRLKALRWTASLRSEWPISHSMGRPLSFFSFILRLMVTYGSSCFPARKYVTSASMHLLGTSDKRE